MSEARRQKLKPPGREGAWQHGAGGGGGLGDNEEGEEGEEGGEARLGPEDVSSWHGVKVRANTCKYGLFFGGRGSRGMG